MTIFSGAKKLAAGLVAAVVLLSCGTANPDSGPGSATVELTVKVVAGPSCPVEHRNQPCPPMPVESAQATLFQEGTVAAEGVTNSAGVVRLAVPAGRYRLVVQGTSFPSVNARQVQVPRSGSTVRVMLDSGIR